jgi:glycerophosphoryl diester phosphodiesterase
MPSFFDGLRAPLHISHRGGAGLYPENTMHAFNEAVRRHATDVLELDVRLSRDGEVVVWHDETVERCSDGTGTVSALSWKELFALDAAYRFTPAEGSGFPLRGKGVTPVRFEELLTALPSTRLNVELKCAEVLEPFVTLVKKHAALPRLCIGSEHDDIAGRLFDALPDACHFYPKDALTTFIWAAREGEQAPPDDRFSVLDMPYEWQGIALFDELLRATATRAGKWVNVWTVNDEPIMRSLITAGVGGVMTDRPDILRDVLGPAPR